MRSPQASRRDVIKEMWGWRKEKRERGRWGAEGGGGGMCALRLTNRHVTGRGRVRAHTHKKKVPGRHASGRRNVKNWEGEG